jgi:hypothetical protein
MRLPIFVLLLATGLLGTALSLRLATRVSDKQGIAFATGLAGGGVLVWLLVTISAFNVVSVSNGSELTHSYPSLATLGVVGVGVSLLVLGKGSLELLDP